MNGNNFIVIQIITRNVLMIAAQQAIVCKSLESHEKRRVRWLKYGETIVRRFLSFTR